MCHFIIIDSKLFMQITRIFTLYSRIVYSERHVNCEILQLKYARLYIRDYINYYCSNVHFPYWEVRCSEILCPNRVHKITPPALLRDSKLLCTFSSYLFETIFKFTLQSPNRTQLSSACISNSLAGSSHFFMLATYPSLLSICLTL
jgi:hypothetical protein